MSNKFKNKSRENLANNILTIRYEKDLSQEKLAQLSGSSSNYISNIEAGKRNPSLDFIDNLAKALGVESDELLKKNKKVKPRLRVDSKN